MAINQIIGEVGGGISIVLGLIAILYGIFFCKKEFILCKFLC